jgi:hypothetical protein
MMFNQELTYICRANSRPKKTWRQLRTYLEQKNTKANKFKKTCRKKVSIKKEHTEKVHN